ncbi:hypothetical protein QA649_23380 [Bradyrhizobium sp. CB1717]|nr:hypothetical protein [Bradyrhizobium sp. CB1717]WFU21065.1 hypothetical protein QA649_23380 [Bradyrhizobium sp. CB1717]
MTLDEKIAQARRHVDTGRLIIERQRITVGRLRTAASIELLDLFEHP